MFDSLAIQDVRPIAYLKKRWSSLSAFFSLSALCPAIERIFKCEAWKSAPIQFCTLDQSSKLRWLALGARP